MCVISYLPGVLSSGVMIGVTGSDFDRLKLLGGSRINPKHVKSGLSILSDFWSGSVVSVLGTDLVSVAVVGTDLVSSTQPSPCEE